MYENKKIDRYADRKEIAVLREKRERDRETKRLGDKRLSDQETE